MFSRNLSCTVSLSLIPIESKSQRRCSSSSVPEPSCCVWVATLSTWIETRLTLESRGFCLFPELDILESYNSPPVLRYSLRALSRQWKMTTCNRLPSVNLFAILRFRGCCRPVQCFANVQTIFGSVNLLAFDGLTNCRPNEDFNLSWWQLVYVSLADLHFFTFCWLAGDVIFHLQEWLCASGL